MTDLDDYALEPEKPFYQVASEELHNAPGRLIRAEVLDAEEDAYARLDAAAGTYRVLYESTSGTKKRNGQAIGVSGLIAFPRTPRPGGSPVLSWAHGTVGSADICAPSMDPYLTEEPGKKGIPLLRTINIAPHALLNAFLEDGWTVAMTDYEGLGTAGTHPYLLGDSEGRGILDIVPAAHALARQLRREPLSEQYAICGHSQGGQAALFAAHMAAHTEDYPGTVAFGDLTTVAALAPASNLADGLESVYNLFVPFYDLGAFYPLFSTGVFCGDPDIDIDEIFQPNAKRRYLEDFDTKSRAELSEEDFWMKRPPVAVFPLQPTAGIFKSQPKYDEGNEEKQKAWSAYWAQVRAFTPAKRIGVPIRLSQAGGDDRVQPPNTEALRDQLEKLNGTDQVHYVFYTEGRVPNLDPLGEHFGLLVYPDEITDVLNWVNTHTPEKGGGA
jgi:hypothetical protein